MTAPHRSPAPRPSIDLVVDGHRAELVDVSPSHALLHCTMQLKPAQKVRIVLKANGAVLRTHARVKSAKYEMPKEGPRYRVELTFEGDTSAIAQIIG